jgi:hypothetical protein
MMIDTGSNCNLLSYNDYNVLPNKPNLQPAGNFVYRYGGNPIKISVNFKTILESKHAFTETLI